MVQQCMCFELERGVMRTASAIHGRVQSAKNSWRSASMSTVLGVSSILLILMDRVLRLRESTNSTSFREPLTNKRYKG